MYQKGDLTLVYITSQRPATIKTYYVNIIVLIKDFYTKETFTLYDDKAVAIKQDTENFGKMFLATYENKFFTKLRAGQNIYLSSICGSRERYESESKECVPCAENSYSTGIQATECILCADTYTTLRDPGVKTFESALYSQACQDYIVAREDTSCEFGKNEDGSCKEEP